MATKKPTPAQLAARKLFAARARAGTLKRKTAAKRMPRGITSAMVGSGVKRKKPAAKRAKNPIRSAIEKAGHVVKHFPYLVKSAPKESGPWKIVAGFVMVSDARDYAQALNKAMPGLWYSVSDNE